MVHRTLVPKWGITVIDPHAPRFQYAIDIDIHVKLNARGFA